MLFAFTPESCSSCPGIRIVTLKYLPFCQRKWKDSTAMTTNQRIKHNLVEELGSFQIDSIKREQLRDFLEKKVYRRAVL